jgi:ABC-2 type transport system ATP-binding protein
MDSTNAPTSGLRRSGTPTIEVLQLHRHFGRLKAVNDISFAAWPGQVIGFIGPNGAGKTTTMRILATLETPTSGDARICGDSVIDDPDRVRRRMGFMPDSFGKYTNTSVFEYLDFYARAYGYRGTGRRDALDRVLTFTELDRLSSKPIETLSKGQSQRLGLGRTLIHDPDVLILDEPAAGLDPRARIELRELIALLSLQLNKTVLISSHILTELGEICDAACIIEAGRVLAWGTIAEIQNQQRQRQGRLSMRAMVVRVLDEASRFESWLAEQPYVERPTGAGPQRIAFEFTGDEPACAALLFAAVQAGFRIVEYHGKSETLEDAFMAITRGIMQ